VTALGAVVADLDGPLAALSVSIPTIRYAAANVTDLVAALRSAADQIVTTLRG